MKKINSIVLILLFSIVAQSQTIPAGENITLDQQLSNIPLTTVTSGIIYERTLQIANLYNFNKRLNFNTANYSYFKQSLLEMNKASNGSKFITVSSLKSLISSTTATNQVDIGILNTQFHILNYNEDNPSLGGLTFNETTKKFNQITGKSPFLMMHNTIIAPLKDYVRGNSVVFKVRNDLYFKNGTKIIKTLVANFGDGINRTLINNQILNNQNITVSYPNSGEKVLTFTITYTDNSTLTTYGKLYFKLDSTSSANKIAPINTILNSCTFANIASQDFNLSADIPHTGYNTGDPSIKAKIDYRVFYGQGNTQKLIKKPIIIIDGFDPGDKRKIEDCDCEIDPECASRNTINGTFNSDKHKSILNMMIYFDEFGVKKDLLPQLNLLGYDVIIVNHPKYTTTNLLNGQQVTIDGGAYYIESNAMALVKLLTLTRQALITNNSTNQIAIIAPSMAGQISKYALSYMEKNNIPHNTYLWISIDSPHLGANVPLGDQALINLVKGDSDEAQDFYDKELSSPASQQQLIEFHREGNTYNTVNANLLNAQTTSQLMPINRGNPMFIQHYNNQFSNGLPNSNGWPQNLRKISLINGSLTGSKEAQAVNGQPIMSFANDNQMILNLRGFQRVNIDLPWPLGSITFRTHIASLEAQNMPSFGQNARIARFKKGFNDRTTQAPNVNYRGVMDNVPGGYFDAQLQLYDSSTVSGPIPGTPNFGIGDLSFTNIFKWISERLGGDEWYLHDFNPVHSFIPTYSALGHLQPNQNWSNPVNTNLTCPSNKLTPFDSYFGLAKNTQHTSFTKESVDWLLKELAGQPQAPNFPIQENALTGPTTICTTATYSFPDICKIPSAVTWTVSNNLEILSQSSYSIIVNVLEDGQGTITATFQNGQTFTKTIWVGKPQFEEFTFNNNVNQNLCIAPIDYLITDLPSQNVTAIFNGMTSAETSINTNWEWDRENNLIILNGSKNKRQICPMYTGFSSFKVRAQNACGWSEWYQIPQFEITLPPNNFRQSSNIYSAYPNPSKDIVTIDLRDQNNKPKTNATISGELFDMMGQSKSKIEIINNKATFSVSGLNKGIYVLKIYINSQVESHQIAVE